MVSCIKSIKKKSQIMSEELIIMKKQAKSFAVSEKYRTFATAKAQMAESVDALVSNTSGATRAGSTPALGTEFKKVCCSLLQHTFCLIYATNQKNCCIFASDTY